MMISIYGAGMAGLLAANMFRRANPVVYERASELPNNHEALLRFRTDAVSVATGIPFTKVEVTKAIISNRQFSEPNLRLNNMYSYKVTGEYHNRSILNTAPVTRYIAPPNFISQMASSCNIQYGVELTIHQLQGPHEGSIISTIPMPALMTIVGWPKTSFSFEARPIWSLWTQLKTNTSLYQTIYYPDLQTAQYRASITGNRLIVEVGREMDNYAEAVIEDCLNDFGIECDYSPITVKYQQYGKLSPVDAAERRRFILAMTDQYRLYSLGRFATWRQILLDDVVRDARLIDNWISDRDAYQCRLQMNQ